MTGLDTLELAVSFKYGWCRLDLRTERASWWQRATCISDAFTHLVGAMADLASGTACVSVLWGQEPGGVFLDVCETTEGELAVVLARLRHDGWLAPDDWWPERGETVFTARVARTQLLSSAEAAFRPSTGAPGSAIAGWPHPFPIDAYDRLVHGNARHR